MSHIKPVKLSSYLEDRALRAGAFSLLPENPSLPLIVSQPFKNFAQFSWIESYQNGFPVYQQTNFVNNTINMLEGTEFSLGLKAIDLSNINDLNDTQYISFEWRKDGALLYNLNKLNNGSGTSDFYVQASSSKTDLTGEYVCELKNLYGSVESEPVTINVIDPLKHPKMYKNLILNGDGDGGLNGWQSDSDIKVASFVKSATTVNNFASFIFGRDLITFATSWEQGVLDEAKSVPAEFFFSNASHWSLFASIFEKAKGDSTFQDLSVRKIPTTLDAGDLWIATNYRPQIIPNEDYTKSDFAAFYPGPYWIDRYNKNDNVIGLRSELANYTPTYFTRDKLKFTKNGGKATATLSQTVDLSEAADFIDGMVCGVKYTTSQFFAYVGCGITDYKIKIKTTEGEKILNYTIGDAEDVFQHLTDYNANGKRLLYESDLFDPNKRYKLLQDTPIEIIPTTYDTTTITLDFLDDSGKILKTETINGPDASDVWAIKEKLYFPLSLWSIFEFLEPNGNNEIRVFDQKYTDTEALKPFFEVAKSNKTTQTNTENLTTFQKFLNSFTSQYQTSTTTTTTTPAAPGILEFDDPKKNPYIDFISDSNARFLLSKFNFKDGSFPQDAKDAKYQALIDNGAAAMFGIGKDIKVPYTTRSVKIKVAFTHTSDIINDSDPKLKGWTSQEIYSNEYGQSTGISKRLTEYGNPRCGITKIKFLLTPNELTISEKYPTYTIPPSKSTTLGVTKALYQQLDAFNSTPRPSTKLLEMELDKRAEKYLTADELLRFKAAKATVAKLKEKKELGITAREIIELNTATEVLNDLVHKIDQEEFVTTKQFTKNKSREVTISDSKDFTYNIPTPEPLQEPPQPPDVFTKAKNEEEYLNSIGRDYFNTENTKAANSIPSGSIGGKSTANV